MISLRQILHKRKLFVACLVSVVLLVYAILGSRILDKKPTVVKHITVKDAVIYNGTEDNRHDTENNTKDSYTDTNVDDFANLVNYTSKSIPIHGVNGIEGKINTSRLDSASSGNRVANSRHDNNSPKNMEILENVMKKIIVNNVNLSKSNMRLKDRDQPESQSNITSLIAKNVLIHHNHMGYESAGSQSVKKRIYDINRNETMKSVKPKVPVLFDTCNGCTKLNFKMIINNKDICNTGNITGTIKLFIMILSAPKHFQARQSIRNTWGSRCVVPTSGIRCVFVLANSDTATNQLIWEESEMAHDVIQFDFVDSYMNLTYKTIMGLGWVMENCMNARHVLKTDDDMYINTPQLPTHLDRYPSIDLYHECYRHLLKTDDDMYINTPQLPTHLDRYPTKHFYGGYCWDGAKPIRSSSKWRVSKEQYPWERYPPLCSGTGYVLSIDVVEMVYNTSQDVPFLYLEDVFVAMSVYLLNISATTVTGFHNGKQIFSPCWFKYQVKTSHGLQTGDLERYWAGIEKCRS